MIDARCPKCRHWFGWAGRGLDAPPCPRCGHRIPDTDLEHDQVEIENFRQLLRERPDRTGAKEFWNRARFAAGLTHGQASKILGIGVGDLIAISEGRAEPLSWLAKRMRELYGLDPTPPEGGAT